MRTEEDRLKFWRDAIVVEGDDEESLRRLTSHAYPSLYFFENVLRDVRSFSGGYLSIRGAVQSFLATLNDNARWIFMHPPPALNEADTTNPNVGALPSNDLIQRRFGAVGLTVAPEKPNVFRDARCRSAREIKIKDETLYCEWHWKVELHRNRVHIHRPTGSSGDKVIVAIICEHLPLPS